MEIKFKPRVSKGTQEFVSQHNCSWKVINILCLKMASRMTASEASDGFLKETETFKIIDIKTSTNGWNDYAKKDENKQFQLLLYKQYFSEQYGIPLDKIEIEFFILKRAYVFIPIGIFASVENRIGALSVLFVIPPFSYIF